MVDSRWIGGGREECVKERGKKGRHVVIVIGGGKSDVYGGIEEVANGGGMCTEYFGSKWKRKVWRLTMSGCCVELIWGAERVKFGHGMEAVWVGVGVGVMYELVLTGWLMH
jgi:hypothetical protein